MITTTLLWSIVLLYSFHLAGHLHNMITNIPNWSSGSVQDMNRYSAFYHKVNNARYFAPVIFITIILCLIALFFTWNGNSLTRNLVLGDLLITVGILITVLTVFRPLNEYFILKSYDPVILKATVQKWIVYNYIRVFMVLIGLTLAVWALNLKLTT